MSGVAITDRDVAGETGETRSAGAGAGAVVSAGAVASGGSGASAGVPDTPDKATLRHAALARRKLTSSEERIEAGHALVTAMPQSLAQIAKPHAVVAAYVSMGTEIETRPLLDWLLARECTVLVPKLGSGLEIGWSVLQSMEALHAVDGHGHLRPDEPDSRVLPPDALAQADMVFAPALGVDQRGYRLGRGAGWYDRALAARRQGCPLIAICWPWEVLKGDLPTEPHDVPANAVLTPHGYHLFTVQ
ncbi:5-formyltetrahydrofolate cyclo-ligase [Bifidobacterium sp. LC6]|uniref:5-formyltetrahydrofolate cyclo-ligase n=1 Tax=Bifidobacterium colobi TaxID=2809026 RepID=A0ABS5USD6_9BIFI|nr:5-formyltetrahydrofolate cyclo-ligase [Bifidobacterium colobi]MBT1173934.1 5-formyltetrahydrofolate cyclo-ligase [Bifidobacterium colobi]